ncbi:DUF177 domain-containing protein [Ruania alkalisoli]|uniref:DUF177 domain-containing protein n=1 Tax=Ruania alkalisoli TaxID=2779775 RepID=A0A7M1SSA1_9MICO|nr:YceD family protein [Ruania alkalisoli]QOR69473.1 DUF177 domain-containing protein [Ruania alkalisoli]
MTPFQISTHDLGRRPGSMRTLTLDVPVAEPMGNEVIAVRAGSEVALDLRLEAVMDGVLVTGAAQAVAEGECVRCLTDVSLDLDADITEMFAYPGTQDASELGEDEELLPELDGETLDLEPTVTDAVVLALPFRPLCRPDCPGLCPDCGIRLDEAEEGHAHENLDPRWSALTALAGAEDGPDDAPDEEPQQ